MIANSAKPATAATVNGLQFDPAPGGAAINPQNSEPLAQTQAPTGNNRLPVLAADIRHGHVAVRPFVKMVFGAEGARS